MRLGMFCGWGRPGGRREEVCGWWMVDGGGCFGDGGILRTVFTVFISCSCLGLILVSSGHLTLLSRLALRPLLLSHSLLSVELTHSLT